LHVTIALTLICICMNQTQLLREYIELTFTEAADATTAAKKVVYTGIFLDDASHQELLEWWEKETGTTLLGKQFGHHMTIKFKPSPEDIEKLPLGQKVSIQVIGWAADEKGQAVLVDPEVASTNPKPHITVAVAPGGSPVYSNELLASGVTNVNGPTLKGIVDTFPREHLIKKYIDV